MRESEALESATSAGKAHSLEFEGQGKRRAACREAIEGKIARNSIQAGAADERKKGRKTRNRPARLAKKC